MMVSNVPKNWRFFITVLVDAGRKRCAATIGTGRQGAGLDSARAWKGGGKGVVDAAEGL